MGRSVPKWSGLKWSSPKWRARNKGDPVVTLTMLASFFTITMLVTKGDASNVGVNVNSGNSDEIDDVDTNTFDWCLGATIMQHWQG